MKRVVFVLGAALLATGLAGAARAETALGAVFGYPGNAGLSARLDRKSVV